MSRAVTVHYHFDPADFARIMRSLNRLEGIIEELEDTVPRKNAIDYSNLLRSNIHGQRHMSGYAAYSERYAEWKEQYALYQGYWKAMGSFVNAITFWKEKKGTWRAGIPAGIYDAGGTSWLGAGDLGPPKPIAMYARTIEYGEGNQPERPIFRPTLSEYREKGFIDRGQEAQTQISRQWR